jgi:DNA integrity scanning protein DisA with diadenylate cyclase activity
LAHRWTESEVNYKGQKLPLNFQEFREDLERVWKVLIEKYMQEQNKKIDELINTLRTKG